AGARDLPPERRHLKPYSITSSALVNIRGEIGKPIAFRTRYRIDSNQFLEGVVRARYGRKRVPKHWNKGLERLRLSKWQELFPCDALEHSHMRAKSGVLCWFKAAAVLAVAECIGVAHAQAQSTGDFFRFNAPHFRSDKYRESLFDSRRWEPQRRKAHRR